MWKNGLFCSDLPGCASSSEHKFSIQVYNVNKSGRYGRAVMLYVNQGDKRKFLCCNDKYEIYPEEMVSANPELAIIPDMKAQFESVIEAFRHMESLICVLIRMCRF